jgi:thiol-disulfide isomerase/thioredoxin
MKYTKIILTIFLASLLLFAVLVSYTYYTKNYSNVEKFQDVQDNKIKIALFYATWCGHCEKYRQAGTFQKAFQKVQADDNLKSKVTFIEYDADQHKDLINKYDINGFPSILSIDTNGNKLKEFEGNRNNIDDLIKFATQSI